MHETLEREYWSNDVSAIPVAPNQCGAQMGRMQAADRFQRWESHSCGGHIRDQMLSTTFDPDNRLVASALEARLE
jgi:hypothetical protein